MRHLPDCSAEELGMPLPSSMLARSLSAARNYADFLRLFSVTEIEGCMAGLAWGLKLGNCLAFSIPML